MGKFSIKNDLFPLLALAMPLALTGIIQSGAFFFETLFLAHVDEKTLAAGALVSWLVGTVAVIIFGTLSAINILVALKHGANDKESILSIARDGLLLSVIFTIPTFLLFWNMSHVFLLFGQSHVVVVLAEKYLRALSWGLFPEFVMIALLEVIIGLGQARVIMMFTTISVILNIMWSYLLIFGKFGLPVLGIAGAGWGLTISYWLTTIILIIYILFHSKYKLYFSKIFNFKKPFFIYELLQIGVPMGVMYCFEVAYFFAMMLMMGKLGSKILAANQIILQYLSLFMSTMFSIAQAITVRMGHLLGANKIDAAKNTNYIGMLIAASLMFLVAIVYCFFPNMLISIDFNLQNPANFEIIHYIKQFFILSAIFQIFEAIRIALFGGLRGLKDTKFTLLISIISFWLIAFPLGYYLSTYHSLGGEGFWMAMILSAATSVIFLFWRFNFKMRFKPD